MAELSRVALCHFAPELGEVERNRARLGPLVERAAALGARWVCTPELALTGYDFTPRLGAAWIRPIDEDESVAQLHAAATRLGVVLLLSHPVRERSGDQCFNAVIALGDSLPRVVHHKHTTVPVVEGWSARGASASPTRLDGVDVGLIVCADAWRAEPCATLARAGARLLLSPAAWPPLPHGPEGCWARRSQETGLPLLVNNRYGREPELDFADAATGVYDAGALLLSYAEPEQALILVDWDRSSGRVQGASVVPAPDEG